jgi:hypothetical protein
MYLNVTELLRIRERGVEFRLYLFKQYPAFTDKQIFIITAMRDSYLRLKFTEDKVLCVLELGITLHFFVLAFALEYSV